MENFDNEEYTQVSVVVSIPGAIEPEYIINTKENFKIKKAYYDKKYNDNLELKANKEVAIVGYKFTK